MNRHLSGTDFAISLYQSTLLVPAKGGSDQAIHKIYLIFQHSGFDILYITI